MNREEIIRMAREAEIIDFRDASDDPHVAQMIEFLQRFADLVAAAEREACAEIMEQQHTWITNAAASALIRARNTNKETK